MRIKDRPDYQSKPKPITLPASANVKEAVEVMTKKNVGSVIIVNNAMEVKGILTERDLMTRVLFNKKDPAKTKISEVMTEEVRLAKEDDDLVEWLRIMSNERFRHLPIVDENGKVVKMMSQGDFVSYTWPELLSQVKETAKATIFPRYQIIFIAGAILLYTLLVQIIGHF